MSVIRKLARSPFFIWLMAWLMLQGQQASAATILTSMPFTFVNGQVADATQVNANFNQIISQVNAGAAASGINNDITALNALGTPLTQGQGGNVVYLAGTSGGSANAQTVTVTLPTGWTLVPGKQVNFPAGFTNSGATTLAVNGGTVTAIKKYSPFGLVPLIGGEIVNATWVQAYYDGTEFVLLNPNPVTSQNTLEQTLTDAASITWDQSLGTDANVTLAATGHALANPTNQVQGLRGQIRILQNGTGGFTFSFGSNYVSVDGSPLVINQAINAETKFYYWNKGASGAGSVVLYPVIPHGQMVLLNTLTASASANLQDTTSFLAGYHYYRVICESLVPGTTATTLGLQVRVSGTFVVPTLSQGISSTTGGSVVGTGAISGDTTANLAGEGANCDITFFNPAGAWPRYQAFTTTVKAAASFNTTTTGGIHSITAWTGFLLQYSSGTIATGSVRVYGYDF